jgi:hypothetical protein
VADEGSGVSRLTRKAAVATTIKPQETLIFLHIPKTAGISVCLALVEKHARGEIFHIRSPVHVKAPIFSEDFGPHEDFVRLPRDQRARFRCVVGHMSFGLHEHIPGPVRYFTVLRDPLERFLSQVGQYNRMVKRNELAANARAVSVEEFARLKPQQMQNPQALLLSGMDPGEFRAVPGEELLDLLQQRLRTCFRAVGTVERFGETMHVLSRTSGWTPFSPQRANVGDRRPQRGELSSEFIQRFEAANRVDQALFQFADQLLSEALQRVGHPPPGGDAAAATTRHKRRFRDWLPWRRSA